VKLVWSDAFPTRDAARAVERQLKGWGREKKLALIRGDWPLITKLAQGKEGPSTSSGKPVSLFLHPHPLHLPSEPLSLEVAVRSRSHGLELRYRLTGDLGFITLPERTAPVRANGLWRHTCFEAFVKTEAGKGYLEFNFAPSARWAAYQFAAYRSHMAELPLPQPRISSRVDRHSFELKAAAALSMASASTRMNLTAVIEEKSGHKSYWALAHPPEGPPDFHHPSCFVLELPPPGAA
jgi:hypothetical protein